MYIHCIYHLEIVLSNLYLYAVCREEVLSSLKVYLLFNSSQFELSNVITVRPTAACILL